SRGSRRCRSASGPRCPAPRARAEAGATATRDRRPSAAALLVPPLPAVLLGGTGNPIHDRVDQPVALALHLHHVHVGDHLLEAIEPDRATRRLDPGRRAPDCVAKRDAVAYFAFERLDRRADELSRHVAQLDIARRPGVVPALVLADECTVLRRVARCAVGTGGCRT